MANCYFAKLHGMQHCYIPFLYVIDFKGALDFGEAQPAQWVELFLVGGVRIAGGIIQEAHRRV